MTLMEGIQVATSCGVLGHAVAMLRWVIKVETRLAVIESRQAQA